MDSTTNMNLIVCHLPKLRKLKATVEDFKCRIKITEQDGSIKKRAKCENKRYSTDLCRHTDSD